jgi:oligopeptide transport system substrate-binding protein
MNRLIGFVLAVVVVLVLAIGAISAIVIVGGNGGDGEEEQQGARPTTEANEEDGGQESAAAEGQLRMPGGDPITLDPALATDAESASYIVEIFGGLVTINPDLQVVPDIAAELPTRENGGIVDNPDGTVTYTFRLRDDVVFHNTNRLVTADDFRYSLERALDPSTASTVAEAYLGDIVGAKDMSRGRTEEVSGIEAVDDFTLKITIDAPKPYFLAKLTYPTAFVVDRQQVESNPRNWSRKPNGTGPYKMGEWRLGESIILEANERYQLGRPAVETVSFLLAGGSVLTMYENDEIDVAGVSFNDIDRVLDPTSELNAEYVTGDDLSISYIGFNTQAEPFDDPKVRQAFAHAIDREKVAEAVLKEMLPVAQGIMMPGLPGYNPEAKSLEFDSELARQLLEESKYGGADGLPSITYTEVGLGATVGFDTQAIVEMWKENLGVEVEIEQTEPATFYEDLDSGRLQMFATGWIMDYPDPEDILDIHFYSQSRLNNTRYDSPQVDDLLEQARTEQNVEQRLSLYRQIEQMVIDEAVWAPLYYGRNHVLVKPNVKGLEFPPMVIPRLRYVTIEE